MEIENMSHTLVLIFILSCLYLKSHLDIAVATNIGDSISADKWITNASTIVSKGGNFEMGFFKPGNASNYYIGIWYTTIRPQTVVWVANRETPVTASEMDVSEFKLVNGNLVLLNGTRNSIWSTSINSTMSNNSKVVATLHDDGNLILSDGHSNNSTPPLWTCFDHPSHTAMTGSKFGYNKRTKIKQVLTSWKNSNDPSPGLFKHEVDINNGQGINMWNNSVIYWSSGPWNVTNFSAVPYQPNPMFNFTYVNNDDEIYYMTTFFSPAMISRFIMDVNGQTKQLQWMNRTQEWDVFYSDPKQVCDVFAYCGPFGTCSLSSDSSCDCLPGFKPKSEQDWDLNSFSGGCVRTTSLQCGNSSVAKLEKDKFWMHSQMRLPTNNQSVTVDNEATCELTCLNNCTCVAYAYNNANGCLIWKGELLNLEQLPPNDARGSTIYIRLAASEFFKNKAGLKLTSTRLKIAIPTGVLAILIILSSYIYYRNKSAIDKVHTGNEIFQMQNTEGGAKGMMDQDAEKGIDVPFFSFGSILAATNDFSEENKLGQGGFGPVYKGKFSGGKEIAVKRLSSQSTQGIDEFKNEVVLIARLQHRNLVRLLGYCIQSNEKILLYEYMANKSLDAFIFNQEGLCIILDWKKRLEIITGIARGLLYLHHDSRLRIIHRDLKTSNILLDEELNPKISDFGLARVVQGKVTEANTNKVVGTYGYMSPEYAINGLFSIKSDVYSFGVIILEIISGRRNTGFYNCKEDLNLLGYAWRLWKEDKAIDLLDQSLHESCDKEEAIRCLKVGLLCVQEDPEDRPTTSNLLMMLGTESMSLPTPNQPAFNARRYVKSSSSTKSDAVSNNELTITAETGR